MKIKCLFFLLITASFYIRTCGAQNFIIGPMAESTAAGLQGGVVSGFIGKKQFSMGGFYLASIGRTQSDLVAPVRIYGVFAGIPIVKSSNLVFNVNGRVGISNDQFLVVIPGFDTRIRLTNWANVDLGAAWRYGRPAISAAMIIRI